MKYVDETMHRHQRNRNQIKVSSEGKLSIIFFVRRIVHARLHVAGSAAGRHSAAAWGLAFGLLLTVITPLLVTERWGRRAVRGGRCAATDARTTCPPVRVRVRARDHSRRTAALQLAPWTWNRAADRTPDRYAILCDILSRIPRNSCGESI